MPNDNYIPVKCIKEVPNRSLYIVGETYSSKSRRQNDGTRVWVGIHGQGGHELSEDDFKEYFE